jgi:uncharacterized protein
MRAGEKAAITILRIYRRLLSPLLPFACRFIPTCSEYAEQAIQRYGLWRGGWLAIRRLASCHPFHKSGFDPLR